MKKRLSGWAVGRLSVSRKPLFLLICPIAYLLNRSFLCAVPPFKSMYEAKYGYKVNCVLCHLEDGWNLNHFGQTFLRQGANGKALSEMEGSDVDRDGFLTKDEIAAKSNPGDATSAPDRAGKWLDNIASIKPPVKVMSQVFPQALSYSTLERALDDDEMNRLKRSAGVKTADDVDRHAVVFLAREAKGVAGGSCYVPVIEIGAKGTEVNVFLLSVNPNGKILDVIAVHVHRNVLMKEEFLRKFRDLFPADVAKVKFPKGIPGKLAEAIRAQFAKYASQVDIVIGP
ncbi:MAG: hypothetical protein AAB091_04285 [Elusimicrobiota bacterium]